MAQRESETERKNRKTKCYLFRHNTHPKAISNKKFHKEKIHLHTPKVPLQSHVGKRLDIFYYLCIIVPFALSPLLLVLIYILLITSLLFRNMKTRIKRREIIIFMYPQYLPC